MIGRAQSILVAQCLCLMQPQELSVHCPLFGCCFFDSLFPGFSSCVFKLSWTVQWGTWWCCPKFCHCSLPGFHIERTEWLWQEELRKQYKTLTDWSKILKLLLKSSSEEVKPTAQLFESPMYVVTFAWALALAWPSRQHWTYWSVEILRFLTQEKSFSEGTRISKLRQTKLFHQNKINELLSSIG